MTFRSILSRCGLRSCWRMENGEWRAQNIYNHFCCYYFGAARKLYLPKGSKGAARSRTKLQSMLFNYFACNFPWHKTPSRGPSCLVIFHCCCLPVCPWQLYLLEPTRCTCCFLHSRNRKLTPKIPRHRHQMAVIWSNVSVGRCENV